jgi:hypothetical protein
MTQRAASPLISDLRELARQRESLVDQMTSLKNDIKRILNITFPKLEHMTGIFTKSILRLLLRYPSAHALQATEPDLLTRMLIEDSYGRKRGAFAEAVLKAALSSIGTPSPMKDMILKQKVSLHLHLDEAPGDHGDAASDEPGHDGRRHGHSELHQGHRGEERCQFPHRDGW